jgi:hypothetical protein
MNLVPESLPVISGGKHKSPKEGACVMEYISLLAGEEWTDYPKCTHSSLARLAQRANDTLPQSRRHEMFSRVNRLFGTGSVGVEEIDKAVSVAMAKFYAANAADAATFAADAATFAADAATDAAYAADAATDAADAADAATFAADAADAADAANAATFAASLHLLDRALDEYDRITGRGATEDVACRLPEVAAKVGA